MTVVDHDDIAADLQYNIEYSGPFDIGYLESRTSAGYRSRITSFTQENVEVITGD